LFWKKKQSETDTISYESKNQRNAFRYHFKNGQGFHIRFKEKKVWVLDICAGGLAFDNKGFQQFDHDAVTFRLDIPNFKGDATFFAGLRILNIDENDICHSIFEQCSLEQYELIHKYVLEMQKNDLAH
jgi:hypothetical protein